MGTEKKILLVPIQSFCKWIYSYYDLAEKCCQDIWFMDFSNLGKTHYFPNLTSWEEFDLPDKEWLFFAFLAWIPESTAAFLGTGW